MPMKMPYRSGDNIVYCQVSQRKMYRSQGKMRWDGLFVHPDFWEPRHPQDFLRPRPDHNQAPIVRADPSPTLTVLNAGYDPDTNNWYNDGNIS